MGKYLNRCVSRGTEIRKPQLFKYMTSKDRYIPFESNASPNLDALSAENCPGVKLKGLLTEMLVSSPPQVSRRQGVKCYKGGCKGGLNKGPPKAGVSRGTRRQASTENFKF